MKDKRITQRGTTITETAIVLFLIIGITGAILVFRTLLGESHVRAQVKQIEEYRSAVRAFYTKYSAYPGDFKKASVYGIGVDGNGNGQIGDIIDEERLFWEHLGKEGLISYDPNESVNPFARVEKGFVSIYFNPKTRLTYFHIGFNDDPNNHALTPEEAFKIDDTLDDGDPITGSVMAKGAGPDEVFDLPPTKGPKGPNSDVCITDEFPENYNVDNDKRLCSLDVALKN